MGLSNKKGCTISSLNRMRGPTSVRPASSVKGSNKFDVFVRPQYSCGYPVPRCQGKGNILKWSADKGEEFKFSWWYKPADKKFACQIPVGELQFFAEEP